MTTTWLRKNLFRSIPDAIFTLVLGSVLAIAGFRFLRFVFVTGRWEIVRANLSLFMTGTWPTDQLWRLTIAVLAVAAVAGLGAGIAARREQDAPDAAERLAGIDRLKDLASRTWPLILAVGLLLLLTSTVRPLLLVVAMATTAVAGRLVGFWLNPRTTAPYVAAGLLVVVGLVWFLNAGVSWNSWGGVWLNLFLAAVSITLCFPVGVLLALARRSDFPILRWLSTIYIELFRGVPLIALLLMANVALGFFIPQSLAPGKIVRALVVLVLFTSAYVAEIVRGGLQSVPRGQVEAGRANGLSPLAITTRIVLPQAIRNVIPSLVGQFISLFKDTTLAGAALGVTDLLSAAQASTAQAEFRGQGLIAETLVFVLLVFWAGSFTMSSESQRLERRLGVGQR
jgi:general L-amino acid transport system permease protein